MLSRLSLSFTDSLKHAGRRDFYDQHKILAVTMMLVVLLLPIAGMAVNGLFGTVAAGIVSFAAYYLTPYVANKLGV
ncbi:MAG TPA: hypothetical protein VIU63_10325 [Nitrospira sp.]